MNDIQKNTNYCHQEDTVLAKFVGCLFVCGQDLHLQTNFDFFGVGWIALWMRNRHLNV